MQLHNLLALRAADLFFAGSRNNAADEDSGGPVEPRHLRLHPRHAIVRHNIDFHAGDEQRGTALSGTSTARARLRPITLCARSGHSQNPD
jgi:hypothetical protein